MNRRLCSSLLFAFVAFVVVGLASAQVDVPHGTANMTSNSEQVRQGEAYQASCDYTVHKPSSTSEDDWELTVAFHKEVMSMNMGDDRFPVVGEFRQNGTNFVFHTGRLIEGMNLWPEAGVTSQMRSPVNVVVIHGEDSMGMSTQGQWKCSVTMKLKGTDAKVRFMSKAYMASPGRPS